MAGKVIGAVQRLAVAVEHESAARVQSRAALEPVRERRGEGHVAVRRRGSG